jgi:hypothetical protein
VVKAGVTVAIDNGHGTRTTTTTDAAGAYAFNGLADGAYTLTPSKAGFLFTPDTESVALSGEDAGGQDFIANPDPALYSTGCSMTFGPPINATTGCSVTSGGPTLFDAWGFSIDGGNQNVSAVIDLGLAVVPTMGVAYALDSTSVHDAYFQVVYASGLDQWIGGKADNGNMQGTSSVTIDSQTDAIAYADHTNYRPHGTVQATVPHAVGPTAAPVTVSASF